MEKTSAFYQKYFDLVREEDKDSRIINLVDSNKVEVIRIHKAGKALKKGQARIKLIFEVKNISKFIEKSARDGLKFGVIHTTPNYQFANTKDPDGNGIQITTRKNTKI